MVVCCQSEMVNNEKLKSLDHFVNLRRIFVNIFVVLVGCVKLFINNLNLVL